MNVDRLTPKRRVPLWLGVAAGCVLLLCVGSVGVTVAWLVPATLIAPDRGEVNPEAAVNAYLMKLSYNDPAGLDVLLHEDQRAQLRDQWRTIRADMTRTDLIRLGWPGYETQHQDEDQAAVTVQIHGTWPTGQGDATVIRGESYPWRFEVRDDDGWRVWSLTPHPWCGGHVGADFCR